MNQSESAVARYNTQAAQYPDLAPPAGSSLGGIRDRIEAITSNIRELHGIADRACGQSRDPEKNQPAPTAVPNGMLDEIENSLDILISASQVVLSRLRRIA